MKRLKVQPQTASELEQREEQPKRLTQAEKKADGQQTPQMEEE
jgi:hypothetical protein